MRKALDIKEFVFDFAADLSNTVTPLGHFSEAQNALDPGNYWPRRTGGAGWGWLNPPYSHIAPWAERCADAATDGAHITLLVPASVGANWFRDFVHGQARVIFLNGRLTFVGHMAPYPKDCMLCLYGPDVEIGYNVWTWRTESCPR